MKSLVALGLLIIVIVDTFGDELHRQRTIREVPAKISFASEKESSSEYWMQKGQLTLSEILKRQRNINNAKNVIMFLGDGMSFPTVAATRVYIGGEEEELSFEKFPHTGYIKTYCINAQVSDSACTATAFLSGVKPNARTLGVNGNVKYAECGFDESHNTENILRWAQKSCKATGIVTTTRITHATPAGAFAHIAHRDWENDFMMASDGCDPSTHDDIAEQLIYGETSKRFNVMLGGGRGGFRNQTATDEEGLNGFRLDGKDLIEEWKTERSKDGKAAYIFDRNGLRNLDYENTDFVLGLFQDDHMKYNLDVINGNLKYEKPTLEEMTVAAIKLLEQKNNGYFLLVEGGKIDKGHHDSMAHYAIDETAEFSKAIGAARQITDESNTLIVVTADHSHGLTYNGDAARGTPIFSSTENGADGVPYSTLSYNNGQGYYAAYTSDGKRIDPTTYDFTDPALIFPATVPFVAVSHAGEDIGIWASGPKAHLFSGSYDQTAIPLIMAHILQVGPYAGDESCYSSSTKNVPVILLLSFMLVFIKLLK